MSTEDGLYPPPDTSRFQERPETIFVYLRVEGCPRGRTWRRVESVGLGSVLSFFGQGAGLEALDEQQNHLSKGENGDTGVIKFALKTSSSEPVPPGNYTVDVYGSGAAGREDAIAAARKSFVVEG